MSKNIVFEGWLTKSPPTKRIWRTKWRRRWFALRQSGELPGQYFLDYYADRNCRRFKGTINLDLCEQVDAGLHMERTGNGSLDNKPRGSVFTIQTQSRIYHLEADCESDMEKWVDAICRVCGLRATDNAPDTIDSFETDVSAMAAMNEQYGSTDSTGPYIPISECITGVRAQDTMRAFNFDLKNIVMSDRPPLKRTPDDRTHQIYMSQPHIRLNNQDLSENDSNPSDEDSKSLNASQSNIRDYSVSKSFTKLVVSPKINDDSSDGPPVPPRPPKTFAWSKDLNKEAFQGPKIQEPPESQDNFLTPDNSLRLPPRRMSHGASISPGRAMFTAARHTDDEDEAVLSQYCNLHSLPPAVDRALKPRHASLSITQTTFFGPGQIQIMSQDESKPDVLQYLDLDLHMSPPPGSKSQDGSCRRDIIHGKSLSATDAESAYKTVDFLKTEAFNITRQDAEASRNNPNH